MPDIISQQVEEPLFLITNSTLKVPHDVSNLYSLMRNDLKDLLDGREFVTLGQPSYE